ncbi:MAG: hypothetical protein PHT51_01820 [Patescibacteria group bacterium]|nr:hypothetical protein [Patescibacteria group bacterium]MDD4610365.1 hypothetical protein [Patescibacteria group bacterium]
MSFSVALIVYKIGYGFDPFIHQATLDLIDKKGLVDPKPFYYLGQYSLEIIAHKIIGISIVNIDKFLVPVLASILLPCSLFIFLKKWFENTRNILLVILSLLIIPFSFFIVTTPQNLAYLFLILTILYGLICSSIVELIIVFIFALASLVAHPIAGIPALFFAILITIFNSNKIKIKKILYLIIFVISSISLPLIFYFIEFKSSLKALKLNNLEVEKQFLLDFIPKTTGQENFILNFVYLYAFNIKIVLLLLIIFGIVLVCKYKKQCGIFFLNLLLALSLFVSYILTGLLSFNYLIEYERNDFRDRILIITVIILLPFIISSLYWIIERARKQSLIIKAVLALFLAILITTSFYITYPRQDRYEFSHNYSVGENEISAVKWIENDAGSMNYIVLANQQVSAAALKVFGFNRYFRIPSHYQGEGLGEVIYFYPIPTSSPLYEYYLKMVYEKPIKKNMVEAMEFVGVNESYFVLNKYWTDFPKILEEAKLEADSWQEFSGGEIYVFKYLK